MNRKFGLKYILGLGPIACLMTALIASAQSLPDGTGKTEFQHICSACHAVSMATNQKMSHSEWAGVVNDMVSRGAQGSPEDLDKIVTYLSTNFSKDSPAAAPVAPAQTAVPAPVAVQKDVPLSAAEISNAKQLVQANGCLSCHRVGDAGSYLGPELTDIGARRTAQQLHDSLVSPNKEVFYENRLVRITAPDGNKVTGRLLDQDSYTVLLIDSSSQLKSFKKSGLREFTILDQNPMPSYANKMSAEDLKNLVHYLSSLKGTGSL